jgi:hypothetical protein
MTLLQEEKLQKATSPGFLAVHFNSFDLSDL